MDFSRRRNYSITCDAVCIRALRFAGLYSSRCLNRAHHDAMNFDKQFDFLARYFERGGDFLGAVTVAVHDQSLRSLAQIEAGSGLDRGKPHFLEL